MKRRVVAVAALAGGAALTWWFGFRQGGEVDRLPIPGEADHVTVEVLNASGRSGLARRVTLELRRNGFDVVFFGTAAFDTLATTVVAVRRGDTLPASRVRDVLGAGTVAVDPDPGRLLDVSVYLGRDVVAPPEFRP